MEDGADVGGSEKVTGIDHQRANEDSMSWVKPLLSFVPPLPPVIRKKDGARMPTNRRPVIIDGVCYGSMKDAMEKLGIRSYSRAYTLIGEKWRYRG